jgi:hypothetical protein
MQPGTGSHLVERFFSVSLVLLFGAIAVVLARTAFLLSLLWIMPLARLLSFVPGIRRWIERKTSASAAADGEVGTTRDR